MTDCLNSIGGLQNYAGDDMTANKHSDHNLDKITVNIMNNTLILIFIHNYNQIENYATACNNNNDNNNMTRIEKLSE